MSMPFTLSLWVQGEQEKLQNWRVVGWLAARPQSGVENTASRACRPPLIGYPSVKTKQPADIGHQRSKRRLQESH